MNFGHVDIQCAPSFSARTNPHARVAKLVDDVQDVLVPRRAGRPRAADACAGCTSAAEGRTPESGRRMCRMHKCRGGQDARERPTHVQDAQVPRRAGRPRAAARDSLPKGTQLLECLPRPGGEIGRRKGLKIPRWQHRTGSIPVPGTILKSNFCAF